MKIFSELKKVIQNTDNHHMVTREKLTVMSRKHKNLKISTPHYDR